MFEGAFATLAELKARLKIATADTTDDAVQTEMLRGVAVAMEAAAGRRLRRSHCSAECFSGGGRLLRVRCSPIAKVHSIRESVGRDFEAAGEYEELVEGDDYVLDAAEEGERPGQSGWIRRLNGNWLGSKEDPGQVRIVYTGGYKTPDELALENATLTFTGAVNTSLVDAFSVAARYSGTTLDGYLAQHLGADTCKAGVEYGNPVSKVNRAVVVFRPGGVLVPAWEIVEATLVLKLHRSDGTSALALDGHILPYNPSEYLGNLSALYAAIGALVDGQVLADQASTAAAGTPDTVTMALHGDVAYNCGANMALLNATLRRGFLAFAFKNSTEVLGAALAGGIATPRHATADNRPSLTLVHRVAIFDPWSMPDDLRSASLLQVAYDWQSRRNPGVREELLRGATVGAGISFAKDPQDLLPGVRRVAESYARVV